MMKVIEVLGYSNKGWEDAAQNMVDEASDSVRNIKSLYIKDMSARVENNRITEYRIDGKVTFEIEPEMA